MQTSTKPKTSLGLNGFGWAHVIADLPSEMGIERMKQTQWLFVVFTVLVGIGSPSMAQEPGDPEMILEKADGYHGVWYQREILKNEFKYKYSGGLGTYCAKHNPFAVHCPEVDKTFFCYGGVQQGYHLKYDLTLENLDPVKTEKAVYHMVSYYDHRTGLVPRPTVLLDKKTLDAHDNPVISVDDRGHIWIFSTSHGPLRPSYIHRSTKPYDIHEFRTINACQNTADGRKPITNFSYMQVQHVKGQGFVYFFTKYESWKRKLYFSTSKDGIEWSQWLHLAHVAEGHYQVSGVHGTKAGAAFNYHPKRKGLNWRTNLYYMETPDLGEAWRTAGGTVLRTPLTQVGNPALVHDFEREGLLVYLKDIAFDRNGHPVILFVTSRGYESGPDNSPRTWRTALWTGNRWDIREITTSDNNYDMGSLYLEKDGTIRIVAPTETGPQPFNPGGEIAMWTSRDSGRTWDKEKQLTANSRHNHTYVRRPVNADPKFYALWADGHGRQPSPSRIYFCNRKGDVFMLPPAMDREFAEPIPVPWQQETEEK